MNKTFKKLTAWLCCMAMIISFIPATALPVFAEEAEAPEIEQIAVTQTQGELPALGANQEYVLSEDLTLEGDLTIHNVIYVTSEVTFDLAGNSIIAGDGANGGIFCLTSDEADLTITDSAEGGKLVSGTSTGTPALNIQKGTATLEAGEITGWTRSGAGGMVFVAAGTFNMAGGKLTASSANYGGAIRAENADAVINMTGGEISGNTATDRAPIWLTKGAAFNMDGGAIKNNVSATYAGAIYIDAASSFTMTDGEISGNVATTKQAGAIDLYGTATITGGTISGNTAKTNGGAICVEKSATLTIDGDVEITDNVAGGVGGGIFVSDLATFTMDGGYVSGNSAPRGGGVSTAEAAPSAVMTFNGGTIEGNHASNRGANLYTYDTALTINDVTIGAALYGADMATAAAAGANFQNVQARGGAVVIKGGNLAAFDMGSNNGTKGWGTLAISGNPVIAALYVTANTAPTIGNLSNGASVTLTASSAELTMQDSYIALEGKTYTYSVPKLPASGTVAPGEYTLTEDTDLTGMLRVTGESEVVIDLAGHTLAMPGKDSRFFQIDAGSELVIKDSVGTGKVQFNTTTAGNPGISLYGTLTLEGGELNGWQRAGAGGLIFAYAGGTFNMSGGKITDCSSTSYTVIRSDGGASGLTVNITGGEIVGNEAGISVIDMSKGTVDAPNTLNISGDAVVAHNTKGGADWTAADYEIRCMNTTVTIGEDAYVGVIYNEGTNTIDSGAYYCSIAITGAPTVEGIRWSASNRTLVTIKELTDGASIKVSAGTSIAKANLDETVASAPYGDATANATDKFYGTHYTYKVPTYAVTVEQVAGGTIEVDVTEGAAGTTVTVTATPDEGFELEAILVNGEAIDGNTFAIVAGENVVSAAFVAADAPLPTSGKVAAGEYVLAADHVLANRLQIADEAEVIIDLAGHTISMPDADTNYFLINAGAKLTIKDSAGGGKVQFKETAVGNPAINVYGEFVLEGGTLTGWSRPGKAGGAIYLQENSTFIMTGGLITDCECSGDVAIRSAGGGHTVSITGGAITGNNAEGGAIVGIRSATAENPSIVTIGGTANISGNTYAGAAYTAAYHELNFVETTLTIEGNAHVGQVYNNGANTIDSGAYYSSYTVTGAPVVEGMRWNSGAKTELVIANLTEGASIKTANGGSATEYDETVVATPYGDAEANAADKAYGTHYTWRDPATVYAVTVGEVVNGTVTVDPAEGVYGTTVTVTAIAAEGYQLEAILVNGKAIDGNTFTIGTVDAEVTATFVEAAVATYDVVVIEPLGGSVSVDKNNAAEGETITITATASEGYELVAIKVNGETIEGNTFVMPAASVQVTAVFEAVEPEGFPTSGTIAAGEYVLTENVQLTNGLTVKGEVVIDLAGYSIFAKPGEGETIASGIFDVNGDGASLTINDSVGTGKLVACNTNGGSHPAVFVQKGVFTLNAGEITGWVREGAGGMIYLLADGTFNMNGGKLTGASATTGSVIRTTTGCTVAINGGEISGNTATSGSVIQLNTGVNFTMTGGAIKNNTGISGGAIYTASSIAITGGEISGNTATKYAGAIYVVSGASLTLTDVAIKDNACTDFTGTSSSFGGGIYVDNGASLTVNKGTVISGNSAVRGGGISTKEPAATATVTITGGTIEGNHASNRGANLYTYDSALTITGGTLGGALYGADKATAPAATADFQNMQARGGVITISGGNFAAIDLGGNNGGTGWGTLNITGNPVIGAVRVNKDGLTVTSIGALTTGAVVNTTTADCLTIAENDETVAHTAGTTLYQFAGDLGLNDKFVPGATVVLAENSNVGGGIALTEAGDYTLDLAGFELTGNVAPFFTVGAGTKLTVIDSSENKTGKIVGLESAGAAMILVDGGSFSLAGGTLTGHTNTSYGGAIYAPTAGSYVAISGGEISGNTAYRGGAISTKDTASAIDVTIEINDGIVSGNATNRGATIYTQTGATVAINGGKVGYGTINGEPAKIDVSGAEDLWIRNSKVTVTGGDINGLYFNGNAANEYTMTISGDPTIKFLQGAAVDTAFIGELTTGARVVTSGKPLTATDDTVHAKNGLYRFVGDVGPLTRILFVGNSFAGDTTSYLDTLSAFYNVELEHAYLYIGSQNIRWHAQSLAETLRNTDLNGDGRIGDSRSSKDELYGYAGQTNVSIPDAMTDGEWDYVVLQPGVEFVGYEGTYNSDIDFLMDYIAAVQPNAKILWSQTWAVDNLFYNTTDVDEGTAADGAAWSMQSSYLTQFGGSQAAMYDAILRNTDLFIAGDDARFDFDGWLPIGIAIQEMRNGYTDTSSLEAYLATRLTRDGFHLSGNAGRMIAGLVTMKTLFPEQVDLDAITVDDLTGLFANFYGNDYRADTFEPTEANVNKLLTAVKTAYGHAVAGTVPAYGDGTANKQFNPDAAGDYVAVYEGITEMGNVSTNEKYATAGAGKIVVYKNGVKQGVIDELWLEENAGIVLTDRYNKVVANDDYYIMADPQAPQLAVVGSKLYMTFDVKLYADEQNTIINGGIYLTTSTDGGETWTTAVKVSDAPMAYGLTALSDGNLILSIADTTTKAVKISAAGAVISSVELETAVADVAFAEVGDNVFALSSTGAMYVSADKGATWTATAIDAGEIASPDMVTILDDASKGYAVYVTWADETELDIYGKIWTVDVVDTANYGWDKAEATVVAEYTTATSYNNKTSGGQPSTIVTRTGANDVDVTTVYTNGNAVETIDRTIITIFKHNLTLGSSLGFNVFLPKDETDNLEGALVKSTLYTADGQTITTEYAVKDLALQGTTLYRVPITLTAKQMGDRIETVICDANGNQLSIMDMYAMTTYLDVLLANNADGSTVKKQESRTLVVDMLNYGAAAQNYLDYATDRLVNAHLTEEQQAWATPEQDLSSVGETKPDPEVLLTGTNMSLKSVVELNMLYKYADVPNAAYGKVTYTNHAGREITLEIDFVKYNSTYHNVKVDTLSTADAFTVVTCELLDADKNPIEGTTLISSIAAYANKSYNNNPTSELSILAKNLVSFGVSAFNYLH